jgi:hypothetical protein
MGVGAGLDAMTGLAPVAAATDEADWTAAARRAGVSQESIEQLRQSIPGAADQTTEANQDTETRRSAERAATSLTWWTLAGTLLSLASAIAGALLGAGPTFALLRDSSGATYIVREGRYRKAV